ncbi:hypothetical protein FJV41_42155 [Myxococcus llanfairpwllgwyngyllgogerychwyrndrobwllllantysiliogogogochensis]|uniref:Lipoprotein n=1 Tax=Myxococcus llanfairpwllgwyngyllgogerychwyrndrobwllllantysiliogogogochensis TaxID=2590453 RepID=A0A540WLM6_9BACT|nr:hypothetical protein [Myxococcus llanfairpwllgwyngyllgogerychwyrndrobwllllantysiliogogogochensis]TQF09918.1 hypothetical protein FJV41_42155 [Myxococcus llanfairpwllgwyngyllgogerychwyrndrobwllllantysiliogogogochensis]
MRFRLIAVLLALSCIWGCVANNADLGIRVRDDPNGPVRYEGPLAGPYDDMETLVDAACERMLNQPVSSRGGQPLGYCAVFFSAPNDEGRDKWFIGHVAPLGVGGGDAGRSCVLPIDLVAPRSTEVLALGGGYDTSRGRRNWHPTLFLNGRTGETWERDVLVFSTSTPTECGVYSFTGFSRVVTEVRNGKFVPVGTVYNSQGSIEALGEAM